MIARNEWMMCHDKEKKNINKNKFNNLKRFKGETPFSCVYQPFSKSYVSKSGNKYLIRSFQEIDIKRLHEMDNKMSFDLLGDESKDGEFLELISNINRLRFHHYRTITVTTMEHETAIGFIIYYLYKYKRNKHVELFFISIHDKYQREGIATKLIETMINESYREWTTKKFKLNVLSNNTNAILFYQKLGFEKGQLKYNYPINGYTSYRYSMEL